LATPKIKALKRLKCVSVTRTEVLQQCRIGSKRQTSQLSPTNPSLLRPFHKDLFTIR